MPEPLHVLLGLTLFLAPGAALAAAFLHFLDTPQRLALAILLAATAVPATMYVLNVFLGLPVTTINFVLLALATTLLPLAWRYQRILEASAG